jgi:hypothetical protein
LRPTAGYQAAHVIRKGQARESQEFGCLLVTEVQPKYWRATARFHFMEKPDSPALLKQACLQNLLLDLGIFHTYVESSQ